MNKKIALIPIMIFVSIALYIILITGYGYFVNQQLQHDLQEIDEVREFAKTYGSFMVSSNGVGFWFEEIVYTHTDLQKDLVVELVIYPQNDNRIVLTCIDISDREESHHYRIIENPTLEEIRQTKNLCN